MKGLVRYLGLLTWAFACAAWATDECSELLLPDSEAVVAAQQELRDLSAQYTYKLGLYHDPFATAVSLEQGERIFRRLSIRPRPKQPNAPSPLAIVNLNLKKTYLGPSSYNAKLMRWVLDDAQQFLDRPDAGRTDLQSNLLALHYAGEYLRRFLQPEQVVDRDGEAEPPEKPEEKAEEKPQPQEEDEDSSPPPPPEYPELPSEYKPFSKNTEKGKGKAGAEHRVAEVNFATPFFGQRYFNEITRGAAHPFREGELPLAPPPPGSHRDTPKQIKIQTLGKTQLSLFVPPLHTPLQPRDPRATITRSAAGGYVLNLTTPTSEVAISLVEEAGVRAMPPVLDVLTRPVGFHENEWPAEVQTEVLAKFKREDGKSRPLAVAQAIADHLAKGYLYSVGPKPETDPIDALQAGAFQCDMAAYAMVGLLRDSYGIPSRIVGGYRAKSHPKDKGGSFLVLPGDAHVWVEVLHDGRWHMFDPTPVRKDKKDDSKGDKSEYSDRKLENTPTPEDEDSPKKDDDSDAESKPGEGKQSSDKEHQKRLEENTQAGIDKNSGQGSAKGEKSEVGQEADNGKPGEKKDGGQDGTDKKTEEKSDKNTDDKANDKGLTLEELADQLELGSLELEPSPDRNALRERVLRTLMQWALEPSQRGSDNQNRLNLIKALMMQTRQASLKTLFQKSLSAHAHDHPPLKSWVEKLVRMLPHEDLNMSYQELHRMRLALDVYASTLDRDGKIKEPYELRATLAEVTDQLDKLIHPDAQDIGLVKDLTMNLPPVARQLLKLDYGLDSVGPNAPTREIAQKLKLGKLNDLRLLSILSPLSDFVLNSTPRPESIEVRTWQRDPKKGRGRDMLPLQRFSDLSRAVLGQPGKSMEDNIRDGTAYVSMHRKRARIPTGYGEQEAERITIVLYDTSGSMSGEPGRFQAGLISAFTARALSDVSPTGRVRHRVVLVPFDDKPGTPVKVTNNAEALDVIRDYQSKLANTNGGTDIQKALLQAMSLIADAEKRSGEPLAAANIVLMTDGQATVNVEELYKARQAIDRTTPLQTLFISINQTNADLMNFALDSRRMGAERGFYKEFTADHIRDILREADTLDLSKRKDFYTETSASELPPEVYRLLDHALRLAAKFSDEIYYGTQHLPAREHLQNLERIRWLNVERMERPLEAWIQRVRQLARGTVFKDRRVLERVVDDLVVNFERITGIAFNDMGNREQEQLRHLLRYAAGLEDNSK